MSILYCGDTNLDGAASYLAGLMTLWGWEFDYVPSPLLLERADLDRPRSLFIFSDYPATQVSDELQRAIVERVRDGAGLLMIGGWESFHGLGGDWDITDIARILPVDIAPTDDRVNSWRPAALVLNRLNDRPQDAHPILRGLHWEDQPPFVGGWNAVRYRSGVQLLTIHQYRVNLAEGVLQGELLNAYPGLVVDEFGTGRVAAFTPDVAPHWVGGFVDWGDARVTAQAPGGPAIEVGNWYAQFWKQLLGWTGRMEQSHEPPDRKR